MSLMSTPQNYFSEKSFGFSRIGENLSNSFESANEVAKGLQYAHSKKDESDRAMGIVHRDITPSNILVSYEGEFKIADGVLHAQ